MYITVLGASGHVGSEITKELASRGHQVRAIARRSSRIPEIKGVERIDGDASEAHTLAGLIRGADAVISALTLDVTGETLLSALKEAGVPRLLVTGGASSLEIAPGKRLIDSPDFPEEWKGFALASHALLEAVRPEKVVDWTYLSPANDFFEGPRTGKFRLGGDQLLVDSEGKSRISYADYAIAMVDELEQHLHSRRRFSAAY